MGAQLEVAAAADHQHRQILVRMAVAVAQAAAVDDERVIEQRAVAVGRVLHLVDEAREQLHVHRVDLGHPLDPLGVAAVVRERVVRIGHADLRIRPHAAFASHHQRDDAGHVGLEGDQLQVEHQVDVVGVEHRDAGRLVDARGQAGEILSARSIRCSISRIEDRYSSSLRRSAGPRSFTQRRRPVAHEIEDAAAIQQPPRARFRRQAGVDVAEQPLEHQPRIRLRRHRRRRAAPREAVGVGAGIAGVAVADGARVVAAELQRGEPRLRADRCAAI